MTSQAVAAVPPRPSALVVWWRALRAYSFPGSIVPVVVGALYAAAAHETVTWAYLPLAILVGVALHIGTNMVNDAADFSRGVDTAETKGGSGVLVRGWLSASKVYAGAVAAFVAAALLGLPILLARGWPLLTLGLIAIVGGYAYTGPPFSLKYRAVGDVLVFLLMGPLMVAGGALAVSGAFPRGIWAAGVPVGFLITAVLAANNQRDREDDGRRGVHTLATLLGPSGARAWTLFVMAMAYVTVVALVVGGVLSAWTLVTLATLPLAAPLLRQVGAKGELPMGIVERIAGLHLFFGLAYALGLILATAL